MIVKVGETKLTKAHKKAVLEVLESNQVSPGAKCREFEEKFSSKHGAKYGCFVNSGTDALRIALLALKEKYGWEDGSTVLLPASTFVATANVILQANLSPRFVDGGHLNVDMVEHLFVTCPEKPVCVIPVHLFGKVCQMKHLLEIRKKYGFAILEDSCESMGVAPLYGDIACYSTYACHIISTGVGGLAITNDKDLKGLMWSYANHGRREPKKFDFDRIGYSARATELQAALGLVELKNLDKNIKRRREIAAMYREGLDGLYDINLPFWSCMDDEENAYMMFPLIYSGDKQKICTYLEKRGIETRDWLSLLQPCYDGKVSTTYAETARDLKKHGFYIGCHPDMTDEQVKYVIKTIRAFRNLHFK